MSRRTTGSNPGALNSLHISSGDMLSKLLGRRNKTLPRWISTRDKISESVTSHKLVFRDQFLVTYHREQFLESVEMILLGRVERRWHELQAVEKTSMG